MKNEQPRIAIVHDYLNQRGGAERVVSVMHRMFPDAPIFTSIVDKDSLFDELKDADIRHTWMQRLPGVLRHFKKYVMLYPKAFESIKLDGYDIILSSSSAFAKGVIKPLASLHVCYCHTPMRFAWDYERYMEKEGVGSAAKRFLPILVKRLKEWDMKTANRPDFYIANSSVVKRRIKEFYGADSVIIPPPVDVGRFKIGQPEGYYLIVSRLNAYKRIELAVEAFSMLKSKLKVVGDGPFRAALEALAAPNVEFLGRLADDDTAYVYSRCRAVIFPGEEDFGIVPLEANAAGRPVIAYRAGGALDTIIDGMNGIFFDEPHAASLADAVRRMERIHGDFDATAIRAHAMGFSNEVFMKRLGEFIDAKYKGRTW
ncbi:MAG: glycosyltransferase [Deltaproteobacteria bacterium]|jgi:glycosyltransferase involved in cell wall biosynthesis